MPSRILTKDRKTVLKNIKDSAKELALSSDQTKRLLEILNVALDGITNSDASVKSGVKKPKNAYMFFNMEKLFFNMTSGLKIGQYQK